MIFRNGPSRLLFMLLILAALILIALDLNSQKFREGRNYVNLIITPLQWLVDMPARLADNVSDVVVSRSSLVAENNRLRTEALVLEQRVLQNAALTAENRRLRALLNARSRVESEVRLAELVGVNPNPFRHEILTNLGSEDGITTGQPALDAGGVMGQVISVAPLISRVMLITDSRAAVPVETVRTGFRSVLLGNGNPESLELDFVPATTDIRVGDLLVTSGLGGRFPEGYPIAEVSEVTRDPGRPFLVIRAVPTARLDKSRHLLLLDRPPVLGAMESDSLEGNDG
ncbi:MAG: rod shape-determining protein MreC [Oceanospirillaceae bacterium]|nr:rod shape-determining protein MreC [Oceanospirillaceae bacterium]